MIAVPPEPIPAAYHKIFAQVPKLIEQHAPDLVVHMGLDVDSGPGVFKVERSAAKEGYHDIPDIERRVFTRAENKKTFAKSSASLLTSLDVDAAIDAWQSACSSLTLTKPSPSGGNAKKGGKGQEKQRVDVRLTDDVGTYVCGFNYYVSMLEMQRASGKRNVVFFHVPNLATQDDIAVGIQVTEELIKSLVGVLR